MAALPQLPDILGERCGDRLGQELPSVRSQTAVQTVCRLTLFRGMDCVVDKINQFATELSLPRMDAEERVMALKFLLHFVGDVHQPLHSSDNHDEGGNEVNVIAAEFREGKLHGYWDTQFVEALGSSPKDIADKLFNAITPSEKETWEEGKPDDWAKEAFALSKQDAYSNPPLSKTRLEHLSPGYVTKAETDASLQLSRAGVRLARMLRDALGTP
jgi:S1/P1 Nuclease